MKNNYTVHFFLRKTVLYCSDKDDHSVYFQDMWMDLYDHQFRTDDIYNIWTNIHGKTIEKRKYLWSIEFTGMSLNYVKEIAKLIFNNSLKYHKERYEILDYVITDMDTYKDVD